MSRSSTEQTKQPATSRDRWKDWEQSVAYDRRNPLAKTGSMVLWARRTAGLDPQVKR